MTTTSRARDMGELIVLIPYVLGYHPGPGLVLVGLTGGRVGPVARIDLPGRDDPEPDRVHGLDATVRSMAVGCDRGFLIVFEAWRGQAGSMEGIVRCSADLAGLELDETVRVLDDRWCWVVDGVEHAGGPVPSIGDVPGVAEFVAVGRAPLPSRHAVSDAVTGRSGDLTEVARRLASRRRRAALRDLVSPAGPRIEGAALDEAFAAWRALLAPQRAGRTSSGARTAGARTAGARTAGAVGETRRADGPVPAADSPATPAAPDAPAVPAVPAVPDVPDTPGESLDPETVAIALRSLDDHEVRDEILGWVAPDWAAEPLDMPERVRGRAEAALGPAQRGERIEGRQLLERIGAIVRATPEPERAAVLTMLGVCAWNEGDGALARDATTRALDLDPDYVLAGLLMVAIINCVRPGSVSRDQRRAA